MLKYSICVQQGVQHAPASCPVEEALAQEIVQRYTVLEHPFSTDAAGADRLQFWRSAWETFEDHPMFGIGSGGWVRSPSRSLPALESFSPSI